MNKRILLTITLVLATAACLWPTALQAQSADQVRIYINSGHGSWGPNDRPMATIPYPMLSSTGRPDTCGFYESNTNLWKCLKLKETLTKMGCDPDNLIMSRVKNGPYPYNKDGQDVNMYNRNLSEICEEVDASNADMFISVHSNAITDGSTTNYSLYLYRGTDAQEYASGSKAMAQTVWPFANVAVNAIDYASNTTQHIRGDINFYGSSSDRTGSNGTTYTGYLGVLKHGVPGFLSEGFFHTYQPARHRALNSDYCGQEGVRYARGICDYFNLTPETTGYIMGTVKDQSQSIDNSLYTFSSNSDDKYAPVMGAKVCLYQGGELVDVYTTDNNYNGIFVFENLTPGTYTIKSVATGYADQTASVTVTANETSYPLLYVTAGTPSVDPSTIEDPIPAEKDPLASMELENDGGHTYADITGTVKCTAQYGDITVVLTTDSHLYKIDNTTHTVTPISTTGLTQAASSNDAGFFSPLNAIAFSRDGVLVGINKVRCQDSDSQVESGMQRGTVRIYKWASLNDDPVSWFTTKSAANYLRADIGDALTVSGNINNCVITATAVNGYSTKSFRFLNMTITNGTLSKTDFANNAITEETSNFTLTKIGQNLSVQVSPINNNHYYMDGEATRPFEFRMVNAYNCELSDKKNYNAEMLGTCSNSDVNVAANRNAYIYHDGYQLMAVPVTTSNNTNTGIALYDISKGIDKATLVTTTNTTLSSSSTSYTAVHAATVNGDLVFYLIKDNQVVKFTAPGDAPEDAPQGIFAYGLNSTANGDGSYDFTFTANTASTAASLIFYDATTGTQVGSPVAIDNVNKGVVNTITLSQSDIPGDAGQQLNWAVSLTGRPITAITRLNDNSSAFNYTRASVTVDNSPESDYFGSVYVNDLKTRNSSSSNANNRDNGIYRYNPLWQRENSSPYTGNMAWDNNFRITTDYKGTLYIPDFGDNHSGVYIAYPDRMGDTWQNFFAGTRTTSGSLAGLITNNGVNTGSSSPSAFVCGSGADSKLYVSLEDFDYNVYCYDLGSQMDENGNLPAKWYTTPELVHQKTKLKYTNTNVIAQEDGAVWIAENLYISSGSQDNLATQPALRYITPLHDDYWSYATNSNTPVTNLNGCAGGGFVITPDGSQIIIVDGDGVLQFFNVGGTRTKPLLSWQKSFIADARDSGCTSVGGGRVPNGVYQMAFDWGGNLYVAGGSLGIYSMPTSDNTHVTPAKKALIVVKEVEPVEATLAQILGSNEFPSGVTYSLADDYLICVYVSHDRKTLYLKDHGNASVDKRENDGRIDYLYNVGLNATDQSNWVALHLPSPVTFADEWEGHKITSIIGMLASKVNPVITATRMPTVGATEEYSKNTYIVANFNPANWLHEKYFFVNPKPMEIATINWAQWSSSDNAFIVPPKSGTINQAGLVGSVAASTSMIYRNDEPIDMTPSELYENGKMYRFDALIMKNGSPSSAARREAATTSYTVYPLAYSQGNILTGLTVNTDVNREVVRTELFNLQGQRLQQVPEHGIYIEVYYYNDGTNESRKIKR